MTEIPSGLASTSVGDSPPSDRVPLDSTRLSCSDVTVKFGGLAALRDVDLVVPEAQIVGLVGPNGAGKSTLFAVMSGLLHPTRGKVFMDGEDVTDSSPQQRAARGLARTFQHPELFGGLTVRDHLVLSYRAKHTRARVWSDLFTLGSLHKVEPAEREFVDELVEILGLGPLARRQALGLPLGSARLLELGRALAASPGVLMLDEPSSGLDSAETEQFESKLRSISEQRGIAVLLVEHDVDLVMRMCASVYVLDFGLMIAGGTPAEVRSDPVVRAAYLGESLPSERPGDAAVDAAGEAVIPPEPEERRPSGIKADVAPGGVPFIAGGGPASPSEGSATSTERAPSGLWASPAAPSPTSPAGAGTPPRTQTDVPDEHTARDGAPAGVVVDDLCVRYGEAIALEGVSFTVEPGKALAVLGANGAGKSSLARAISGLVRPSRGRVLLGPADTSAWPAHRVRRAGLVYLPETRGIFRGMTVTDNLRMAAGCMAGRRTRKEAVERAFELFPALAARRRQQASLLSGGEQQMLSLARALATFPKVMIADEMSLGLAPMMVDLVFDGLARARGEGVTLIMIEQYVHRALEFADRCIVLQRGELAWSGAADAAHGEVLRHYLGEGMAAED